MKKVPGFVWSLLACVLCVVVTAAVCLLAADNGATSDKYQEILRIIESDYYREEELTPLEDAAAKAMVAALNDDASYYMNSKEYEQYKLTMSNQYVGIGVTTEYSERYGYLSVVSVTPGSPADQAHIKIGNLIAQVNDIDVSQYSPEQLTELMRSFDDNEAESDKYFELTLLNTQGGKATVQVKCELIYAEPVYFYMLVDTSSSDTPITTDIGYIQIKNFDDSAAVSLTNAVSELQKSGAKSLIFDVRDNQSGKPGELAEVLDSLLPQGDLFLLRDRMGKETTYTSGPAGLEMPMVVLVNENTSCAAEIFACAMQQAGIEIVGRRTAASAQSQTIVEMEDGSAIRLSQYEYLTPDKKSMTDLDGVFPDIVSYMIDDSDMDVQLEAAIDFLG